MAATKEMHAPMLPVTGSPIDGPSHSGGCGARSGFIGTVLIGRVIEKGLYRTLCGLPLTLAVVAAALATFGASTWGPVALLAVWGAAFRAAPVAGWTWLAATAPNDAETGVGLMVAGGQMAITLGATLGDRLRCGWCCTDVLEQCRGACGGSPSYRYSRSRPAQWQPNRPSATAVAPGFRHISSRVDAQ